MAQLDDDAVTHRDAMRAVDLDDITSGFHAGRERQLRLELILAGRHQDVGEIDPGRADRYAHLSRRQWLRVKCFQPQPARWAEFAANDSFWHYAARSLRRAKASRNSGRRSLPKYMSVLSMKMVGEPKPPRAITSSVLALSWSLTGCCAIPASSFCGSTPTRRHASASTASCEMSWSSPQ